MARTNVEDSGFTKAMELAHELEWEPTRAAGALLWLWHESQAKSRLGGSGREIIRWSKLKLLDSEAEDYLAALEEFGLIRPVLADVVRLENEFEIAGNADEITRIVSLKEKSKKGGESTRRKWEKEKIRAQERATSRPDGLPDGMAPGLPQLGTDQIRSVQISSDQIKEKEKAPEVPKSPPTPPAPRPGRKAPPGILQADLDRCKRAWFETLAWAGQGRETLTATEEELIVRAIMANQSADLVELALIGAQHEPPFENFNPRDHVDIARVLLPDREGKPRIQKFVSFGARAKKKEAEQIARKQAIDAQIDALRRPPEEIASHDPDPAKPPVNAGMSRDEIRSVIGGIFKPMPKAAQESA